MDTIPPLRIILNGKAAKEAGVRQAVEALRAEGCTIEVRQSREAGDLQRMTREALSDAARGDICTIVAAGGDGTVNEVFGTAYTQGVPEGCALGILPLGTANDFATAAGLPVDDLTACLRLAASGPVAKMDIGVLDGRPFINLLSGGFGSKVTSETDPELKARLGSVAYLLTGIARLPDLASSAGRFEGENFAWEGAFIAVAVGNGRLAGGGIPLCPDAVIDDGKLDLMVLSEVLPSDSQQVFASLLSGGTLAPDVLQQKARSSWFEYSADRPLNINLDGEPLLTSHFRIECMPAALPVRLGPCPLLSRG